MKNKFNEWISLKNEIPPRRVPKGYNLIVINKWGWVDELKWNTEKKRFTLREDWDSDFTHWMLLTKPTE